MGTPVSKELTPGTGTVISHWSPQLAPGPYWGSFEKLRTMGSTALDGIKAGSVGTLRGKSAIYRILVDNDFQKLVGLASEVHRLKQGITCVLHAARVVAKHQDQESLELLIHSASMLTESRVLPERDGHDRFEITTEEVAENTEQAAPVKASEIRRPTL
jgi:hypothetical protein